MHFAYPSMLVALVALAIPLAIHLLGRQRARRVVLPTARFAEGAHQSSRGALRLKRIALLSARLAIIVLLVLALAGPRLGGTPAEDRAPSVSPALSNAEGSGVHPSAEGTPQLTLGARKDPIRVLVVDAAYEKDARFRSADLVAAALAGESGAPKQVTCRSESDLTEADLAATDVLFWIDSGEPSESHRLVDPFAARGLLVQIPSADSTEPAQAMPAGVTIDPGGYTSDLVAAFEAGTSGDLGAPVLRRRIVMKADEGVALRFRDGAAAITDVRYGQGRVVSLAFGPAPVWGDLAGRPEFVVLLNSLAEAALPRAPSTSSVAPSAEAGTQQPAPVASTIEQPAPHDLTLYFVLALALALVVEGVLSALATPQTLQPRA